jgi:DNA-binding NarL/FixJ family response regulator
MPKTNKEDVGKNIVDRLDVIINLLYDIKEFEKKEPIKSKVAYLARAGVDNKSIAKILGISEKHVSKEKYWANKNG